MTKKLFILRTVIAILTLILIISAFFVLAKIEPDLYVLYKQRNSLFTLTHEQVLHSLSNAEPQCKQLKECPLLPGDILIRRYITEKTRLIDRLAHPYFTHSAFYLGDDQIIEAVGKEKDPENEIHISKLSESDWYNTDIESLVILRPKNISTKINAIQRDLRNIAADPDYIFGLPRLESTLEYKRATCADLIFNQLSDNGLLRADNIPKIITPDYLFWSALRDPSNFETLSYWFSK